MLPRRPSRFGGFASPLGPGATGRRAPGRLRGRMPVILLAAAVLVWTACGPGDGGEAGDEPGSGEPASGMEAARADTAAGVDSARVAGEITAMLEASAGSWNAGDLEGFLDDYLDSPEMTFVGGSGVARGRDEVRARYEASYWAPGSERDSLRFEEIEVRPLGAGHALTLGRYVLYRPPSDSVTATGRFTLVLRRQDGEWKIVHDHSS